MLHFWQNTTSSGGPYSASLSLGGTDTVLGTGTVGTVPIHFKICCRRSWRGSAGSPCPKWATGLATRGSDTRRTLSRKAHADITALLHQRGGAWYVLYSTYRVVLIYRAWKKSMLNVGCMATVSKAHIGLVTIYALSFNVFFMAIFILKIKLWIFMVCYGGTGTTYTTCYRKWCSIDGRHLH